MYSPMARPADRQDGGDAYTLKIGLRMHICATYMYKCNICAHARYSAYTYVCSIHVSTSKESSYVRMGEF